MSVNGEIAEGYMDGLFDHRDVPPEQSNRSIAYWHGWLNGRDDRIGKPRKAAALIRRDYENLATP